MSTRTTGIAGEDIACKYLQKHKYKIVQRNFSCSFGEVDIIAKNGKYLVFVEVKRRLTDKFGLPREAVTEYKQQTIVACAKLYLAQNKLTGVPVRFDVVDIQNDVVTLIVDAFRP